MIANASQVRIPCESPVPSRPVPSLYTYSSIKSYVPARRRMDEPLRGSSRCLIVDIRGRMAEMRAA